jgi:hypothetical protein
MLYFVSFSCPTHPPMPTIGGQTTGSTRARPRKKPTTKRAKAANKPTSM